MGNQNSAPRLVDHSLMGLDGVTLPGPQPEHFDCRRSLALHLIRMQCPELEGPYSEARNLFEGLKRLLDLILRHDRMYLHRFDPYLAPAEHIRTQDKICFAFDVVACILCMVPPAPPTTPQARRLLVFKFERMLGHALELEALIRGDVEPRPRTRQRGEFVPEVYQVLDQANFGRVRAQFELLPMTFWRFQRGGMSKL
ncbi:hypothetical protein GGTG_08731 [Gaeumannomyces tritici R3-111a-1]|uniref:Uncharacterized protein n=1 Tax=Gaeumannomyces tritici (strain R3-111a-1) TaxID=644352 RepID=J3P5E2_GAET3|nr:hypothetical protein GGTG_08731 [Gaeumannomyces tritici R3-111a-1]EJT74893.1 hypothetical protein GGTG_08731 [Gaeumannomyces tritici R3-111a-1]